MTGHAINALEALIQALNHKISNLIIASGLVVAGQVSEKLTPPQYKPLSEISVTEIFTDQQSAGTYIAVVGCCWIIMQMSAMAIRGINWLMQKYGKNK